MKTTGLSRRLAILALCAMSVTLLAGCLAFSKVHGIQPIYPKTGVLVPKVDSLQPEFKWKDNGAAKGYDLAVWNTILVEGIPQRRKLIYEKAGLSSCSHRMEIPLEADSFYYWSVRETGSEKWSSQTVHLAVVAAGNAQETDLFLFFTPRQQDLKPNATR